VAQAATSDSGALMERAMSAGYLTESILDAAGIPQDADYIEGRKKPNEQRPLSQQRMRIVNFVQAIAPQRKAAQEHAAKENLEAVTRAAAEGARAAAGVAQAAAKTVSGIMAKLKEKADIARWRSERSENQATMKKIEKARKAAAAAARIEHAQLVKARAAAAAATRIEKAATVQAAVALRALERGNALKREMVTQTCISFAHQCWAEAKLSGEEEDCHCANCGVGFNAFGHACVPLPDEEKLHAKLDVGNELDAILEWETVGVPRRGKEEEWRCPVCKLGNQRAQKRRRAASAFLPRQGEEEEDDDTHGVIDRDIRRAEADSPRKRKRF